MDQRVFAAAGLCSVLIGCDRSEDCKLYHTCPGDLLELTLQAVPADNREDCQECLERDCRQQLNACSTDWECSLTARCRIQTSPLNYQTCIKELYRNGFTQGQEIRKPWEGAQDNVFDECRTTKCAAFCTPDPFDCSDTPRDFSNASVTLAVRTFSRESEKAYGLANDVLARACYSEDCDAGWVDAGEQGHIPIALTSGNSAASLFFEIQSLNDAGGPDFPPTLFYPRMMGPSGPQLLAVYVVRNRDIRSGNDRLGFGYRVLEDAAQSLILPDGCTREVISLPNLRVSVTPVGEKDSLPQCHVRPQCGLDCTEACVWYARGAAPARPFTHTDGTGAGAVGVSEGEYLVEALNEADASVSERTVRMRKGWMTIVRTWPVPKQ